MKRKILILPDEKVIFAEDGENLLQVLASVGVSLPAACGGKGTCGKCRVRLVSGSVLGTEADEKGEILACRASVCGELTVALLQSDVSSSTNASSRSAENGKKTLAAALDVGTTTLALCLVDPDTGKVLDTCSALNPQGVLGADVLSRIEAWGAGKGALLQRLLLDRVREMLSGMLKEGQTLSTLTVAANTTMLHLLLNVDPTSIGVYPFTPRFTDTQWVAGNELGLPVSRVCLLPSVSGYIGSDVVAGALACDVDGDGSTALLVDIGTNGEIMLSFKGELYATSTAAGPALEGACIECGMGGVAGAVDHVTVENGELMLSTVGGTEPRGICGSGLIDLIACLLREGLLCESGAFEESDSPLASRMRDNRFYLCEDVYLSQQDVRQYQLAKSAIASGILTLTDACGVRADEISRVLIAGGLGYYMNIENAAQTGLLPRELCARAESVGNTALTGACQIASDPTRLARAERLARSTKVVELGGSAAFSEAYMMNMMLDEV